MTREMTRENYPGLKIDFFGLKSILVYIKDLVYIKIYICILQKASFRVLTYVPDPPRLRQSVRPIRGEEMLCWPMRDLTWPVWTLQLQPGPDGSDHIEFSTGFTPRTALTTADGEKEINNL